MRILLDYEGYVVRLPDDRLAHILSRAELAGHEDWLESALLYPEEVRYSVSDEAVKLFYRFRRNTKVGDKWLCVVTKYLEGDAFVITAYLTDKIKRGKLIWRKP